jgi:uncharacterized membrane-anchored protein YjiN (DUF445 family)
MIIYNFEQFINEEYKTLKITKLILEQVCKKFSLDSSKIKFLNSGYFGNAYAVGDKVLKITSDYREVNDVKPIIGKKINGVVKYYKLEKVEGTNYFAILMERVDPLYEWLLDKIKDDKDLKVAKAFTNTTINLIIDNWGKIDNFEGFEKKISEFWTIPKKSIYSNLVSKFWTFYKKIYKLSDKPFDAHVYNLGFDQDGEIVMFDFNKLGNNYRKI